MAIVTLPIAGTNAHLSSVPSAKFCARHVTASLMCASASSVRPINHALAARCNFPRHMSSHRHSYPMHACVPEKLIAMALFLTRDVSTLKLGEGTPAVPRSNFGSSHPKSPRNLGGAHPR